MNTCGFEQNMTESMLRQLISDDTLWAEIEYAHAKAMLAYQCAVISLPATAASGKPVVHGTRNIMSVLSDYWVQRRDAAKQLLDLSDNKTRNAADDRLRAMGANGVSMNNFPIKHEQYVRWLEHTDAEAKA